MIYDIYRWLKMKQVAEESEDGVVAVQKIKLLVHNYSFYFLQPIKKIIFAIFFLGKNYNSD